MRFRWETILPLLFCFSLGSVVAAPATEIALPGAPADGVSLDYLAVDQARHRVWVPAGGTGNTVVIDTKTRAIQTVDKFATVEVERRGKKRLVGPSSATVGDGFVHVGSRADASVSAVDATTLARGKCVTLPTNLDGLAFVARSKEVWVTTPRDQSIVILDVSTPAEPKIASSIKFEGDPEGYSVDDSHGVFYANLGAGRVDVQRFIGRWKSGVLGGRGGRVAYSGYTLHQSSP